MSLPLTLLQIINAIFKKEGLQETQIAQLQVIDKANKAKQKENKKNEIKAKLKDKDIIEPFKIKKGYLPEYIKELLMQTKENWSKDKVNKISLNQIIFYNENSKLKLIIDETKEYKVPIIDGLEEKEITGLSKEDEEKDIKGYILTQIGLISMYLMLDCNVIVINNYFKMGCIARFPSQAFINNVKGLNEGFTSMDENCKKVIIESYEEICFLEGILCNEAKGKLYINDNEISMYTIDELLQNAYIKRIKIPPLVKVMMFKTKDNRLCSCFKCLEGGMAYLLFKTRPVLYIDPNGKKTWFPYYIHKNFNPSKSDNNAYLNNEKKYNEIIEKAQHKYIHLSHSITISNVKLPPYTFLMKFLKGVSLSKFIKEYSIPHSKSRSRIAYEFILSLKEFYSLNIAEKILAHRDIKPDNLILSINDKNEFQIKLIDYGIAGRMDKDVMGTLCGTLGYRAPEISQDSYERSVDFFSVGISLIFVLTKLTEMKRIWKNVPPIEGEYFQFLWAKDDKYNSINITIEEASFIENCVRYNAKHRFNSIDEMINHPFLSLCNNNDFNSVIHYYINKEMKLYNNQTNIMLNEYLSYRKAMRKFIN